MPDPINEPQVFHLGSLPSNAVACSQVIDKVVADRDQLQDQLAHSIITVEQLHSSFQGLAPLLPEISKSAATFRTIQHKVEQLMMKPTAGTPGAIISPTLLATDIQDTSDDVSRAPADGTSISPVDSKEEAIITPEAASAAAGTTPASPAKPLPGAAAQSLQADPAELQSPQESPYPADDAQASSAAESCGSNSRCAASPLSSGGAKDTATDKLLLISPSHSSISKLQKIATTRGSPAAAAADGSACRSQARKSPSKPSSSPAAAPTAAAAGASPDQTSPRLVSSRAARMAGAAHAAVSRMMSPAAQLSFGSDCWPSPAEQKTPSTPPCNGNDTTSQLDIPPAAPASSSVDVAATGSASGDSPASVCEPAKPALWAVDNADAHIRADAAASDHSTRQSTSSVDAVADLSSDVMPAAGTAVAGSEATQDDAASAEVISKLGSQPAHSSPPRQVHMQQELSDISAGRMPQASASPEDFSRAAKRRNATGNHSTDASPQHSKKARTSPTSSTTPVQAPLMQQQAKEILSAAATPTPSSGARKAAKTPRAMYSPVGVNAAEAAAALAAASAAIQKLDTPPSQAHKSSQAGTATSPPASASMLKAAAAQAMVPQDSMASGGKAYRRADKMQLPPAPSSSAAKLISADKQAGAGAQSQKSLEGTIGKAAAAADTDTATATAAIGQSAAAGVNPGAATSASADGDAGFSDASKAAGVAVVAQGSQPQGASSADPSSARSWAQVVRSDH